MDVQQIITIVTAIVTIASVVVAITPTPHDNKVLKVIYKVIEGLSLTIGRAKEK